MTRTKITLARLIAVGTLAFLPLALDAQEADASPSATTSTAARATTAARPAPELVEGPDLQTTFQSFDALLRQHPSEVGRVLQLDPTLFRNQVYMANYPALSAFITQHPEIPQNPRFFLQNAYVPEGSPKSSRERIWNDIFEGISIITVFSLVAGVLMWLIRTLTDYRRWSRVSRVQAEVHGKLLDRFTSSEDLLAYVQSSAGKRFLESAPIPLSDSPRAIGAPVTRVLWSLQIGVVMAAAGLGLLFVSARIEKEVSQPFFALAVLAVSVGLGFVASAVMAYLVSRRLGLWTGETLPTAKAE